MERCRSDEEGKCGLNLVKFMSLFVVFPLLLWLAILLMNPPSDGIWALLEAPNLYSKLQKAMLEENDGVCVSRRELPLYRQGEARRPSPHLVSKLGSYEARHRRCGPHTHSYNKALAFLQSNTHVDNSTHSDCKYIVWLPCEGLGNRMLTLASAFLYALLTDRVLLAHRGKHFSDLFCEPFPQASLFLPSNFPLAKHLDTFNQHSNLSYGNLLTTTNLTLQPYVYLNLIHDYALQDQLFFCDQDQTILQHIPWLIMKSDLYFAPSLLLMPSFQQELHDLFPEKDTVFHLLAQYLFHPTNSVWGLVTRYYQAYLSKADVRVGIQVRVFDNTGPFTDKQILSCIKTENILPPINHSNTTNSTSTSSSRISIVMASLRSTYFERVKDMYWENPTETGESVSVFQPSHEEYQQTEKVSHDRKALAEMYLLSLTDKLVTSGWSTFGYVGAALGGVKPWILHRPQNETVPNPACGRAMSMEPCFHFPPYYDCKMRTTMDPGGVLPHVRHCEDVPWGIKLL